MVQQVKNLPAMQKTQEMWVQSLGWEDPLEEEMATYSSILAWKIPWTKEPNRLQSMGLQQSFLFSLTLLALSLLPWEGQTQLSVTKKDKIGRKMDVYIL